MLYIMLGCTFIMYISPYFLNANLLNSRFKSLLSL